MPPKCATLLAALPVAVLATPTSSFAQDSAVKRPSPADLTTIETITVTAEKRESALLRTPIAVTALTADDLERSGIEGHGELQFHVPGLTFGVVNADTQISLRGVGNENITPGGDPGVALHLDGVYLGRPSYAFTDFFDLDRIEVLRGPQGTLYGRNSTGGSINLITKGPASALAGSVELLGGDYDRLFGLGTLSGPLTEKLFARLSATANDRDGYHENLLDGSTLDDSDYWASRAHLELDLSPSLELRLSAHLHRQGGAGTAAKNLDDGIPDLRRSARDFPQSQDNDYEGLTASLNYTTSRLVLTSISSYPGVATDLELDSDGTALPFQNLRVALDADQLTQELRIASAGGGRGEWLGGVYFFTEDIVSDFDLNDAFFGVLALDAGVETESWALFGQYSYSVTDRVRLRAGLRYNDDDKQALDRQFLPALGVDFALPQESDWQEVTGDVGADFELAQDRFLYAKVSRGYKSGGFNLPGDGLAYDPEIVYAYEVGSKSYLANRRVQLDATLFRYDYQDMQVFQIRNFQTLIENAAESTVDGVEVALKARPVAGNLIQATLGYLDATYDEFVSIDPRDPFAGPQDLSGNRLNRAPELSVNLGIQHSFSLGETRGYLTPRAEYSWRDEVFFRQFNYPEESQGSFSRTDLRLLWGSSTGRYHAQLFVTNLEDEDVIGNLLISQAALSAYLYGPRTWGGRFGLRF